MRAVFFLRRCADCGKMVIYRRLSSKAFPTVMLSHDLDLRERTMRLQSEMMRVFVELTPRSHVSGLLIDIIDTFTRLAKTESCIQEGPLD